jgi:hypothetical protein
MVWAAGGPKRNSHELEHHIPSVFPSFRLSICTPCLACITLTGCLPRRTVTLIWLVFGLSALPRGLSCRNIEPRGIQDQTTSAKKSEPNTMDELRNTHTSCTGSHVTLCRHPPTDNVGRGAFGTSIKSKDCSLRYGNSTIGPGVVMWWGPQRPRRTQIVSNRTSLLEGFPDEDSE